MQINIIRYENINKNLILKTNTYRKPGLRIRIRAWIGSGFNDIVDPDQGAVKWRKNVPVLFSICFRFYNLTVWNSTYRTTTIFYN
jgi:hypothetical protein